METQPRSGITLPGAIIAAGALIAVAIIYTNKPVSTNVQPSKQAAVAASAQQQISEVNLAPVTAADHIMGNPNAPIKIVEFSDPSCPYCKTFNPTMVQIMNTYGLGGKVAWVYRAFPLDKPDADGNILHKNAGRESQAMECAAALGGNDIFWAYQKKLYEITPSVTGQTPNGLDQNQLPIIAKGVGLNVNAFNDCLASGKFKDKIEAQYTDGINAGVTGTPTSFIITPSGSKIPLAGGVPYSTVKAAIDTLIPTIK